MTDVAQTEPDTGPNRKVGERIVRASLSVSAAHVLLKVIGLVQAIVAGQCFSDNTFDVVYVYAFEGVIFSVYLIGEEVIGPGFLPVFLEEKNQHGEDAAWLLANTLLTAQFLLLGTVVTLMMCFPGFLVAHLTHWDPVQDAARFALAKRSVMWLAPSLICLSLGSTTYMLLNGYKRFFLAAVGDAAWKSCVLISLVIGVKAFGLGYRALIFGLLVGSVAKLATHLFGLARQLHFFRPALAMKNPAFRRMLYLMLPLVLGILFAKFRDLYNNVTILSYLDHPGLMKANSFGRKLYFALTWFVPYAISIAMFPFFCELVDRDDRRELGRLLTESGRMLLAVFLPGALLISVVSEPLSMFLFRGGQFGVETVHWAALSNACYILVLPAFALEQILMQGYFAHRKMVSVVLIGIIFSLVSVGISYFFIVQLGYRGAAALCVVALGYVVARTLKTITLIGFLKRSTPIFPLGETLVFLLRILLVAALTGAATYGALRGVLLFSGLGTGRISQVIQLAAAGSAGTLGYLLGVWLLRVREPIEMVRWAEKKIRQRLENART